MYDLLNNLNSDKTCGDCPPNAMCDEDGDACVCKPGYEAVGGEMLVCEEKGATSALSRLPFYFHMKTLFIKKKTTK